MQHPAISIVIRCFNEEQHIGRLLSGIMAQTRQDFEVILVDSGSTDATLSIAERFPVKIVMIHPDDFSFGRALNLGCAEAKGTFLVAASAHVYPVYYDWLERLTAPFADEEVALVYGKQRGNEVTKFSEHRVFAQWFPEQSNVNQRHPFCNNANAAIRRTLWEQLPYDEELTGLEDLDWARRVLARGYKLAYAAEAEIIHVHQETPRHILNRYRREAIALKRIFPEEHMGFREFVQLYTANIFEDSMQAWREGVLHRELGSILSFRLMQFWGSYQGFQQHGPVTSQLKRRFYYPTAARVPQAHAEQTEHNRRIDYSGKDGHAVPTGSDGTIRQSEDVSC